MSSRSKTKSSRTEKAYKLAGAIAALGVLLAGCSDIYIDRRETIALSGGDFAAVNSAAQMIDPWPRYVGDKNIAFNGERMQGAVERYRRHEVIRPVSPTTSTYLQQTPPAPLTTEHVVVPPSAAAAAAAPVAGAIK